VRPRDVDADVVGAGATAGTVVVVAGTVVVGPAGTVVVVVASMTVVVVAGSMTVVAVAVWRRPDFLAPGDGGVFPGSVDVVVLGVVVLDGVATGVEVPVGTDGATELRTGPDLGPLAAAAGVAPATEPTPTATRVAATLNRRPGARLVSPRSRTVS
jgi:hypothetical protein